MSAERQVLDAFNLLKSMRGSLTDSMQVEVDEWMACLRADFKADPDSVRWEEYGRWLNQICIKDGMPTLFREAKGTE